MNKIVLSTYLLIKSYLGNTTQRSGTKYLPNYQLPKTGFVSVWVLDKFRK